MSNIEALDSILIRDYIQGDNTAFTILIKRYESRIYAYIYSKIRNKTICKDIFQDTIIKVIKKIKSGSYDEQGKFLAWICRIAHNLIIDQYRKNRHKYLFVTPIIESVFSDLIPDESPTVESKIITEQIHQDLKKMIDELTPEQKEIVILKIYNNLTHREIAELKEISINTSIGRLRYAIINLRRIMERNQVILTT